MSTCIRDVALYAERDIGGRHEFMDISYVQRERGLNVSYARTGEFLVSTMFGSVTVGS
jgi:hypothetical protein